MPKVYGYVRVSTQDQADSGVGLAAQRMLVEREFDYRWKPKEFEWGGWFEEAAVSGAKPFLNRPKGLKLSVTVERGDVILFPKLDRAFRRASDALAVCELFQQRGVVLHFLDLGGGSDTLVGKLILTVMAAVAEMERGRISERSKEVAELRRRKGLRNGCPPYGMRMVGAKGTASRRLVVVPEVFELGLKVKEYREVQGHSFETIAHHFNWHGVAQEPSKAAKRAGAKYRHWSRMAVWRLYRGTLRIIQWLNDGRCHMPHKKNTQRTDAGANMSQRGPGDGDEHPEHEVSDGSPAHQAGDGP